MRPYTEEPIPSYAVTVEQDGCFRGYVDLPTAYGTLEQCKEFISNHLPPRGADMFGIQNLDTGRQVSYVCNPPTVARRIRLHWEDLCS